MNDYVYIVGPGMINNVTERHLHTDTGADSWYYQYDHRGNVVAVTDSTGKILRGYQYDAFGNIPFSFATGQSGAAPTDDILFTGKDLDPDTGLYYFNARWYDSDAGRFLSRGPFDREKEHPYSCCEHNPLTRVDPEGKFLKNIGLGLGRGAGAIAAIVGWYDVGQLYACPIAVRQAWIDTLVHKMCTGSMCGLAHCIMTCEIMCQCGMDAAKWAMYWQERKHWFDEDVHTGDDLAADYTGLNIAGGNVYGASCDCCEAGCNKAGYR